MNATQTKQAIAAWQARCADIQSRTALTTAATAETPTERAARIARLLASYPDFCEYYFAHYMQQRDKRTGETLRTIRNAPFHNEAARLVRRNPTLKAVFMWPRGHAKSTHFDIFIPIWLMMQQPRQLNVMVIVGKSEDAARTLLSDLQAELENNRRLCDDFGEQRGQGAWQDGQFVTAGDVAFFARGRGQSPRGLRHKANRPDYIVIDDLDDDELCRNDRRVRELTDWVREALFGALDAGRGRFLMVGNLISRTSVLAEVAATRGVRLSKVAALDSDGNPVWADKWTRQEAEEAALFMGYRAWHKEMMHNPITTGAIFRADWIRFKRILPLCRYRDLVCYTDPSFRSSTSADFKACRLWGLTDEGEMHLIDCFVRQATTTAMVGWLYDLYERTRQRAAVRFYMEAGFMQDILLDEFRREGQTRGYQLPILPDRRKKPDKLQRIEAISPLWERGLVFYNEALRGAPDMQAGIDQTLALEHGSRAHDDAPDADEGAIWMLSRTRRAATPATIRMGARRQPRGSW